MSYTEEWEQRVRSGEIPLTFCGIEARVAAHNDAEETYIHVYPGESVRVAARRTVRAYIEKWARRPGALWLSESDYEDHFDQVRNRKTLSVDFSVWGLEL